jgi:hypothetical protein
VSAGILNLALSGLVAGAVAAMLVALLAMRWPRLAATAGTLIFPLVLVAPLMRSGAEIAVDHRRAETTLLLLCLIVAALLVVRELYGHLGTRHRWTLAPAELRAASGIDALYIDPASSPAAHGVLRLAVVIPSASVPRAVLLHERAHHVWRDPATAALRRLVRAVFWFHPGLSILEWAIRQASELAADAAATRGMAADERAEFAETLVAASRVAWRTGDPACPQGQAGLPALHFGELEERVLTLLGLRRGGFTLLRLLILAAALLAVPFVPQFVPGNEVIVIEVIR